MATTKFEKPVGSETFQLQQQVSTMNTSLNALTTKVGNVGSTDLQTQVNTLNSNFEHMFTRQYRTYTNIRIPSSGYIKVDSYSEMEVNTSLYLSSMTIRGWGGNISGVTIGKGSGGTEFYLIGEANKTISNITVEYVFSKY